jgi:hypothetical protein
MEVRRMQCEDDSPAFAWFEYGGRSHNLRNAESEIKVESEWKRTSLYDMKSNTALQILIIFPFFLWCWDLNSGSCFS